MSNTVQHTRFSRLVYHTAPCGNNAGSVLICIAGKAAMLAVKAALQSPFHPGSLLNILVHKNLEANGRSHSSQSRLLAMNGSPAPVL